MKKQEDHYRQLFAQDRHNSTLSDIYLNLVDVFNNRDTFKYATESAEDRTIPKILAQKRPNLASLAGQHSVVDEQQYVPRYSSLLFIVELSWLTRLHPQVGQELAGLHAGPVRGAELGGHLHRRRQCAVVPRPRLPQRAQG
jgi:hypothetical protein